MKIIKVTSCNNCPWVQHCGVSAETAADIIPENCPLSDGEEK